MIEYKTIGEKSSEILNVHDQYRENRYMWMLSRDFIKGEATVKRKNELYLPMPSGFLLKDDVSLAQTNQSSLQNWNFDRKYNFMDNVINDDPNYHPNKPYAMYKHGAKVPSILKHTVNGLLGLIVKKPLEFINDEEDVYNLTDTDQKQIDIEESFGEKSDEI